MPKPKQNIKKLDIKKVVKNNKKGGAKSADDPDSASIDDDDVMRNDTTSEATEEEIDMNENMEEVENEDALEHASEADDESEKEKESEKEEEEEEKKDEFEGEECLYRFSKNSGIADADEFADNDDYFEEETDDITKYVPSEQRQSKPVMTKYERVRILGERARQISLGAKPMMKNTNNMDPKEIARAELNAGMIPFFIERIIPGGKIERWRVAELKIIN